MNNFKDRESRGGGFRGGAGGGRPSFPKKSWGGDDRGGDKPMFQATCSKCQKSCEVPFRPNGSKPVYCRDCFNGQRDAGDSRGGARPDFNSRGPKRDFNDRPSFRSAPVASNDDTKRQLSEISTKLDRLIGVIEKMNGNKKEVSVVESASLGSVVAIAKSSEDTKTSKKGVSKKKK